MSTKIINVAFAEVYALEVMNKRTQYGSQEEQIPVQRSLAVDGWKDQFPGLGIALTKDCLALGLTADVRKSHVETCLAERQAKWDALKAGDDIIRLRVFERLYVKDGKLIAPKYLRNSGFRRSRNYLDAMVLRVNLAKTSKASGKVVDPYGENDSEDEGRAGHGWDDTDIISTVPLIIREYTSELERIIDQQLENETVDLGRIPIYEEDKLRIVKEMMDKLANSGDIRKVYGSQGQKYHGIVKNDIFWPSIRIFDRCLLDEKDDSHIPIKKIRHGFTSDFTERYRNMMKPVADRGKSKPIDEEEVRKYYDGLKGGKPRVSPILTKKDFQEMSENHGAKDASGQAKNEVLALVSGAALTADGTKLAPIIDAAEVLNLALGLSKEGNGKLALLALTMAKAHSELVYAIADAQKTGASIADILAAIKTTYVTAAVV